MVLTIATILLGFVLLGRIPFGLVLTRAAGLGDIRAIGSGNIGATNVLRTGRRDLAAAATLLLDGAEGRGGGAARPPLGRPRRRWPDWPPCWGTRFPAWLRFRGGKGVATGLGVLFGNRLAAGMRGLRRCGWLRRRSAVPHLLARGADRVRRSTRHRRCICCAVSGWPVPVIGAWIVWRHRSNIARLRAGAEPQDRRQVTPAIRTNASIASGWRAPSGVGPITYRRLICAVRLRRRRRSTRCRGSPALAAAVTLCACLPQSDIER